MRTLKRLSSMLIGTIACLALVPDLALAKPSKCETCHAKISPEMVKDFSRGKMSKTLT